jgi:hypothetical protein
MKVYRFKPNVFPRNAVLNPWMGAGWSREVTHPWHLTSTPDIVISYRVDSAI